jgi:hypothetical protein
MSEKIKPEVTKTQTALAGALSSAARDLTSKVLVAHCDFNLSDLKHDRMILTAGLSNFQGVRVELSRSWRLGPSRILSARLPLRAHSTIGPGRTWDPN